MLKRKVLFICPSLCQGGLEHFQISMLQALDSERFDITLFLYLKDTTLLPLVPENVKVIIDNDRNHYFRKPKAIYYNVLKKMGSILRNKKLIDRNTEKLCHYIHDEKMKHPAKDVFKNEQFDVVVANAVGQATEMALHFPAQKYYAFFHSSLDMHHELLAKLFPRFDGIVAVSLGVKEMLQSAYPEVKDKVLLLENYISAKSVLEKAEEQNRKIEIDRSKINICSCGRLSSEKGFDMAVEVAHMLDENGYQFKWYFIGGGKEQKNLENMIKKYSLEDKICITGYMNNPFHLMKCCDMYVQPSYEESYGRTIKEAMILGLPVVSTATVGADTLIKDGANGVLTEINAESLGVGVKTLIDNKELQLKFGNCYSLDQDEIEKKVFEDGLKKLLV